MRVNKVQNILDDINRYEANASNFNTNVKDRLNKTLELYLNELNTSYIRLKCKKTDFMVKELSKR